MRVMLPAGLTVVSVASTIADFPVHPPEHVINNATIIYNPFNFIVSSHRHNALCISTVKVSSHINFKATGHVTRIIREMYITGPSRCSKLF